VTTQGPTPQTSGDVTIEGTITDFGCGDNCYLSVTDGQGTEHSGLCAASLCDAWNDAGEMPAMYKGKRVRAVMGKGTQVDGFGEAVATMEAFTSIQLLK